MDFVIPLPCDDPERWQKIGQLLLLLGQCKKLNDLEQMATLVQQGASYANVPGRESLLLCLTNLCKCLSKHFTVKEQSEFLTKTLPQITQLASELPKLVPLDGIPFLKQQRAKSLSLTRRLVASLLANGFLCTFLSSVEQGSGSYEGSELNFDQFFSVFSWEDKNNYHATQMVKLRSILCYFNRIASNSCDIKGLITISRNVVPDDKLPVVNDWRSSSQELCPIVVKTSDVTSHIHTLQMIPSDRSVGCNMLQSGRMEEELKFCQFPELMIMLLVCDEMESNETLLVKGIEQFCHCRGCGSSIEFVEEITDRSKRDSFGTFQTMMVAIDAVPFRAKKADNQYRQSYVLRELNKALVGFYCTEMRGDSMVDPTYNVQKVLESSGGAEMLRNDGAGAGWHLGGDDDFSEDTDGPQAASISDLASSIVDEVVSSVTNDSIGQFASTLAADIVTEAVHTLNISDDISQFASEVIDQTVDSILNCNGPSKTLTVSEVVNSPPSLSRYQSYAEELTTVIISNALQSVAQDESAKPTVKVQPTVFNEQLNLRLQRLVTGQQSPNKLSTKPSSVRTPSGWNECMSSLNFSANSRKTNSMIWSSAATVNDGSDPPSPSELASLCLDDTADTVADFAADLSSQIVAEAISSVVDPPIVYSKVDTSTSTALLDDNVDFPGDQLSALDHFSPHWSVKNFNLLRPVAAGNWGVGACNGDVQLKGILLWMAVSATGRPFLTYYTDGNEDMENFAAVCSHVLDNVPNIGKLADKVLTYCTLRSQNRETADLFTFLFSQTV